MQLFNTVLYDVKNEYHFHIFPNDDLTLKIILDQRSNPTLHIMITVAKIAGGGKTMTAGAFLCFILCFLAFCQLESYVNVRTIEFKIKSYASITRWMMLLLSL